MPRRTIHEEPVDEVPLHKDEDVLQEMVEAEEELRETARRDMTVDTDRIDDSSESNGNDIGQVSAGTIRSVVREGSRAKVKYIPPGGSSATAMLSWPDSLDDDDEALNRLFDLCGVTRGRITNLPCDPIPVVKVAIGEYDIHLPDSSTRPAL